MTIGCNIWMICLKLIWFFNGLSHMLRFSQVVWALSYSVWHVFSNFLLIDTTDRSKISSDQKRFFIALTLYPLSFFTNTPFNFVFKSVYIFGNFNLGTDLVLDSNPSNIPIGDTLKFICPIIANPPSTNPTLRGITSYGKTFEVSIFMYKKEKYVLLKIIYNHDKNKFSRVQKDYVFNNKLFCYVILFS